MNTLTKRVSRSMAGAMIVGSSVLGVGALTIAGASPAQAATPNYNVGPFATKSACEAEMRTYISSWTKISQACTYYPKQGGFTDNGYWFHYRAIA